MKVSLVKMSPFNQNTFTVVSAEDGKEYTCHCSFPGIDWDKLYDYLMLPFEIKIVETRGEELYVRVF